MLKYGNERKHVMKEKILDVLNTLAEKHDVEIIYACEAGSRLWGFPSVNSDYDVRFFYVHPLEWYMKINEDRDTIEFTSEDEMLDFSGWDLRKALRLFKKCNPLMLEWLQSTEIYIEHTSITQNIRDLIPEYYAPIACFYHYLSLAKGNYKDYLCKDGEVWTKKYLYVLRAILATNWVEKKTGPVPVQFIRLVNEFIPEGSLKEDVKSLVERKCRGEELGRGERIESIHNLIVGELSRLGEKKFEGGRVHVSDDKLDKLFLNGVKVVDAFRCSIP